MDGNVPEDETERQMRVVQDRIDVEREHVSHTVEALAYKTDIGPRSAEVLADGIESAKHVASEASNQAAAIAVEIAGRASDSVSSGLEIAQSAVEAVEPQMARRLLTVFGIGVTLAVLGAWMRRKPKSKADVLDTITSIDEGSAPGDPV